MAVRLPPRAAPGAESALVEERPACVECATDEGLWLQRWSRVLTAPACEGLSVERISTSTLPPRTVGLVPERETIGFPASGEHTAARTERAANIIATMDIDYFVLFFTGSSPAGAMKQGTPCLSRDADA